MIQFTDFIIQKGQVEKRCWWRRHGVGEGIKKWAPTLCPINASIITFSMDTVIYNECDVDYTGDTHMTDM